MWTIRFAFLVVSVLVVACGGAQGSHTDLGSEAEQPAACDDGNPCTYDDRLLNGVCSGTPYECPTAKSPFCVARVCDGLGGCKPLVNDGFCFIGGACFTAGTKNPSNQCSACLPEKDSLAWSPTSEGGCTDSDVCTKDDHCEEGRCVGTPTDCDDGNVCTRDSCDPNVGCVHEEKPGECDDGDVCSVGDTCEGGVCKPGPNRLDCDDKNPCTVDTCKPYKGCESLFEPMTACNDGNQCTVDSCEPSTGCTHAPLMGPCDDGNACTVGDYCEGINCKGGADVLDCEDNNVCTADSCNPAHGCIHAYLQVPCDDGEDCTENDVCLVGKCSGKKTAGCGFCKYGPNPDAHKITLLELGTGHIGGGMDLDDNPDTCAPASSCSNGIDNELGQLGVFVNDGIKTSLAEGTVMYVFEFKNFSLANPFTLNLVDTGLADSNPFCKFQSDECDYEVAQDSLDVNCNPLISFNNAQVVGNVLRAGGEGYAFPLQADLIGGQPLVLGIASARLQANLLWDEDKVVGLEGFLGGGVAKEQLMDTLSKLPAWVFPMDKKTVLDMLDTLIVNDLDTDGDKVPDAASINFKFKTIPANLVSSGQP